MSTQVLLTIPDNVYQQITTIAQATRQEVEQLLNQLIGQAFPPLPVHPERAVMEAEVAAFETMHGQLWQKYPHHYVAVHHSQVIDHDEDEAKLIARLDEQYPDTILLIRQLLPQLPPPLIFRSPRWVN